jgi:tetratricopeptide (TPR) repeat protein
VPESQQYPSIDAYLEQARQLWDKVAPEPPSQQRLREIAQSVDMSDAASEEADRRSRDLTLEARQLIDDGNDEEAEPLLRDAVLLSPLRVQPWYFMARIYADRQGASGDLEEHARAKALAERAQSISPTHGATRSLLEQLGTNPQDGLPWRKAALIVFVIILISGTLQVCHRYVLTPDVTEEQLQQERQYWEEYGDPQG